MMYTIIHTYHSMHTCTKITCMCARIYVLQTYTCTRKYICPNIYYYILITLFYHRHFADSVRNFHVASPKTIYGDGDSVVLRANGLPLPHFRWVDTVTNRTTHEGDTLVLDSTQSGALSYRCTATNIVRGRTYRKQLEVEFSVAGNWNIFFKMNTLDATTPLFKASV